MARVVVTDEHVVVKLNVAEKVLALRRNVKIAAKSGSGRALVVVYLNRESVVIELDPAKTRWSLIVVSTREAKQIAHQLGAHRSHKENARNNALRPA